MKIHHVLKSNRKILLLILLILLPILFIILNRIFHCDNLAQSRLVRTPDEHAIAKFNKDLKVIPFGQLSKHCMYAGDQIDCPDVRSHGETMLRQAQLAIVRMLKIVDLICTKYSIDYWMMSGLLLGAYRYNLTIPWDDDGDIGMLDNDYVRFSKLMKSELPEYLFFQDDVSSPEWTKSKSCTAKIRDKKSCYSHCLRVGCNWHDGLQIDIFVFSQHIHPGKPTMLVNQFNRFHLPYEQVFPVSRMSMEGVQLLAPSQTPKILERYFGSSYMKPPRSTCPGNVFMAIPWYTCEYIINLPAKEKKKVLLDSMVHDSLLFWYFG